MKILLYPHGGSGNHGCEALVRTTIKITGAETILASASPEEDCRYGVNDCCRIIPYTQKIKRLSLEYLRAVIQYRIRQDRSAFDRLVFEPLINSASNCDLALSIGGDNYCYGEQHFLYLINRELRKKGVKTILWGCSITPELIQGLLLEDLKRYNFITARESLTFECMRAKGLDRIALIPDPAFTLCRKETRLPPGFMEANTVGINVSPLLFFYKDKDLIFANYVSLIETILRHSDMTIALIPHVVWPTSDDRGPLKVLYERFKDSGRVILVEDRPAEQMKDIIARCRFMVAARTHASIAAYSQYVPTIVVGYSVKASGIARDIFGKDDSFVVPVQAMSHPADLSDTFNRLIVREREVKEHLLSFMPNYCARAAEVKMLLTNAL